jgi:tRNA (guanine37-N1)-methyltransferase
VLFSGNHQKIADWQEKESLRKTWLRRPEMLEKITLSKKQQTWLAEIFLEEKADN